MYRIIYLSIGTSSYSNKFQYNEFQLGFLKNYWVVRWKNVTIKKWYLLDHQKLMHVLRLTCMIRRKERKVQWPNAYRHHQGMLIYCGNIYAEMFACTPGETVPCVDTSLFNSVCRDSLSHNYFYFSVPLTISSIVINTK